MQENHYRKGTEVLKLPSKPIKILFVVAGFLALGLGIVGIFLPLLPTTPLIILAAACFLKGSERLYRWITKSHTFGSYIHNYLQAGTIPAKSKPISILLLWIVILTSVFLTEKFWLRIILITVACGVTIHLVLLKTTETSTNKIDRA